MTHLDYLMYQFHMEKSRLAGATSEGEIALRTMWVAQLEREVAGERAFLGLPEETPAEDLDDAELLAELLS